MDVSAIFRAVLTPEKERNAENFSKLSVGERIVGRVLHVESDGRALIDMGGFRAMAHTTIPVQVGQKLPLTVIRTGDPTQLRLDPDAVPGSRPAGPRIALMNALTVDEQNQTMKSIDRVIDALTENGSKLFQVKTDTIANNDVSGNEAPGAGQTAWRSEQIQQALNQLKAAMKPMSVDGSLAQQTQWVQSAVEDNGILFEIKLAQAVEKTEGGRPGHTATEISNPSQPPAFAAGQTSGSAASNANAGDVMKTALPTDELRSKSVAGDARGATQTAVPSSQDTPYGSGQASTARFGAGTIDGVGLKSAHLPTGAEKVESGFGDSTVDASIDHSQSDANLAGDAVRHIAGKDLKPQLMMLKDFLTAADETFVAEMGIKSRDVETLNQSVERLLKHVEQQQERAVRSAGEPDLFQVFTHMLPIKDQTTPLCLKVYYPKKGKAASPDRGHRIALLLDMDQIGLVRADLALEGASLRINFFVSDDSVRGMFEKHAQNLNERLEGEFEQVVIGTQVSREKIAQFEGEDLTGPPLGKVDIKA